MKQVVDADEMENIVENKPGDNSEALQDPWNTKQEISADEAFEIFDVDGDGHIQKGDLEYVYQSHVFKF